MDKIKELKKQVYEANIILRDKGLAILTWGNASAFDRSLGIIAIKPSGVSYDEMTEDDMVLLKPDGQVVDNKLKPSSDTATHLYLYQNFSDVCGVVHTHSKWATIFAQMGKSIPCFGTTHADTFYGEVPCTRSLTLKEINTEYERETGKVIVEHFCKNEVDSIQIPAVLVKSHGPFTWGNTTAKAVENALILENIAFMAWHTMIGNSDVCAVEEALMDKHFLRKHGHKAYYGQGME